MQHLHKSRSPHQHNIVRVQYYAATCNLQPITAYRPIDGISPLISRLLTEHVPDDRHHGHGADHFLATFISVVRSTASCLLRVVTCRLKF